MNRKYPHFAIPEIYGESLSYYELLRKLVETMNIVIENYDTIPDQIAEAVANLDASQLFSEVLNQLIHSIATDNTKSANAVKVYKKHDLIYATFNETVNLYESLIDFSTGTGTELIPGTNIREVNISELFIELRKLIDINKNNIEAVTAVANENSASITTIHGDITAIENKNTEQDNEISTLRTMISSPYNFKGDVASTSALPETGNVNDTYYVQDLKYKVTWTGSAWLQSSLSEADYQTELSELKGDISNYKDNVVLLKNCVTSFVDGKHVTDSGIAVNPEYGYVVAEVEPNKVYSLTNTGSSNFTWIKDKGNNTIGKLVNYPYGTEKNTFIMPEGAKYLYVCSRSIHSNNGDVVCLQVNKSIVDKGFTVADFPYNTVKRVLVNKLYLDTDISIDDYVESMTVYDKIHELLTNLFEYYNVFGSAVLTDTNKVTISDVNGGIMSNTFTANSEKVLVIVKGEFTTPSCNIQLTFADSTGKAHYRDLLHITDGVIDNTVYFDAANLIVYNDAVNFNIIINCLDGNSGDITISEMKIVNLIGYQTNDLFDEKLSGIISNIFSKTDSIQNQINNINTETAQIIRDGSGNKYSIQVGMDGSLRVVPHIPTKALFMGNSLLLGIDTDGTHGGAFGMCATSPQHDYFYHVKQAILEKNSKCTFSKLHDASFEQAETDESSQNYISTNLSHWTEDLDLIIVQIGDNVNSEIRKTVFTNNLGNLVKTMRENSPKARVIFVSGWFNNSISDTIMDIVTKRGCEFLNISSLRNDPNNYQNVGDTITFYDGTTTTVKEAWVTHPGNNGMKKIADIIINKLNM